MRKSREKTRRGGTRDLERARKTKAQRLDERADKRAEEEPNGKERKQREALNPEE